MGLAALGNLLQPYAEIAHIACGALSLFLVAMLVAKLIIFLHSRGDMKNSVFASVSATFFMTLMQLAGYLAPYRAGFRAVVLGGGGAFRADGVV